MTAALLLASLVSFGIPSTPDTPDVPDVPDVPEIPAVDMPGIAILDEIALKLEEAGASVEDLATLFPEFEAIDTAAEKLRELSDTDPEVAAILEDLEVYRQEAVEARERLTEIRERIDSSMEEVRTRVEDVRAEINEFVESVPGLGSAQI
jgi:ElaB/YqjD/DUF883 family membrane-anchored ribosome-binding protein